MRVCCVWVCLCAVLYIFLQIFETNMSLLQLKVTNTRKLPGIGNKGNQWNVQTCDISSPSNGTSNCRGNHTDRRCTSHFSIFGSKHSASTEKFFYSCSDNNLCPKYAFIISCREESACGKQHRTHHFVWLAARNASLHALCSILYNTSLHLASSTEPISLCGRQQVCEVGVASSRRFLAGVGIGFLRKLGTSCCCPKSNWIICRKANNSCKHIVHRYLMRVNLLF